MNRPLLMSIAAVERDTGLSKDTLRVWEKRYGFPAPERDAQGERCYPMDQIERLRVIKRLLDVGHRPGRVVTLPMVDLGALASRSADAQGLMGATPRRKGGMAPVQANTHPCTSPEQTAWRGHPWLPQAMVCIEQHDPLAMRHVLARALATLGLPEFIASVACPLLQALGEGWLRGRIQIAQEHWVSHLLQQTLHSAIHDLPLSPVALAPRVLLSTFPGEPHGLGLLVVEAWLSLLQAQAINLGPQTPMWDLVQTATLYKADVLALSFTANAPATLVQDTLAECRAKLPAHIAIWAGGQHPLLQRKPPEGVLVLTDMASVQQALAPWRPRSSA